MRVWKSVAISVIALLMLCTSAAAQQSPDLLKSNGEVGQPGGRLVVALRAEPKTLNPVTAIDSTSREVIRRMHADLIHINRATQGTEPALAKSWTASADGMSYTVRLRRGLKFSDGHPFDADDVVFTFQVYEDEKVHSPQRDLLVVGGKPLAVRKIDQLAVQFAFSQPYAAGDRVFDSIAILPRHLLEAAYKEGKLSQSWTLATAASQIAGLGPYRLKQYVPGQSVTLERNPYYWKLDASGKPLPYLAEIAFLIVPNDDAQVLRFESGETDVISRLSPDNFDVLAQKKRERSYQLVDAGPGLEYNFLLFNLNDDTANRLPDVVRKQQWFRDVRFRQAVSSAIDRESIVRLVFRSRGVPLWAQVTPGNKLWMNQNLPHPPRDLERARGLLRAAGFRWSNQTLTDAGGQPVQFTIVAQSSSAARSQMATIIQQDLKQLGMQVQVVPLESRAVVDRVMNTHDYDAAIMGLQSGDVDPTAEMSVWLSSGATHLWNLGEKHPATSWEAEIDRLMQQQETTLDAKQRKRMYDRVQQIVAEQLPIICLAAPEILVAAKAKLGNFRPAIMEHYTLHNVDELYWRNQSTK